MSSGPEHWARHLLHIRDLQARTGGFTEFVPLPFVPMEAPIYLKGRARRGPTFREAMLMHAVARLVLHPLIPNIQASWVKLGPEGAAACLGRRRQRSRRHADERKHLARRRHRARPGICAGADGRADRSLGRTPRQRTTLYADVPANRSRAAYQAPELLPMVFERRASAAAVG